MANAFEKIHIFTANRKKQMKHYKQENIIKILNDTISPVTSEKIKSSNNKH